MRYSVGYELTESVRAAILEIPEAAWVAALDQDGSVRENGEVAEITGSVDLCSWPQGSRLIVRRERPHPGAQLSFTDHDGHRFQTILTDQDDENIALIECRHRQHAHVEDRIRDDKDTGLRKFPFKEFALTEVWLEIVTLAHDLIVWTQALLLDGELAKAEPKRLRYRAAARRGPTRVLRTARQAPPSTHLAMGHRARRRVPKTHGAPSPNRLTAATGRTTPQDSPFGHGHDHGCPHTGKTSAGGAAEPPTPHRPRPTPPRSHT